MTRREIAELCCRVMALDFLAWAGMSLVGAVSLLGSAIANSHQFGTMESPYFFPVKILGSLGCFLLLFAMALGWKAEMISRWMAPDDRARVTGPEISSAALMPVACIGVGLFAVTQAASTFFRFFAQIALRESMLGEAWESDDWKISLVSAAMLLAWGIWLMFGNRGLVCLVKWARSVGKESPIEVSGESTPPDVTQREER